MKDRYAFLIGKRAPITIFFKPAFAQQATSVDSSRIFSLGEVTVEGGRSRGSSNAARSDRMKRFNRCCWPKGFRNGTYVFRKYPADQLIKLAMIRFYSVVRPAHWASLALLFILCLAAKTGFGQLTISGEVTKPLTLQAADLKALPHTDVTGKDRDGKEHTYSGVPLADLLKLAGATMGGELRGQNLMKYVVVKASDGYETLYALPELDAEFATRTIILADSVDGSPLPSGVGPYRIVVPGEKKPARWVREVKSIEVRFAR